MADSVVYGPETRTSPWDAWRTSISPAISNKPTAIDEQENDGSEMDEPEIGRPEINGRGFKGWAHRSSILATGILASSTITSSDGAGAAATLRACRNPAQDADL